MSETFLILRRIQRDIINVHRSSRKVPRYSRQILIKVDFSQQIFQKYSNITFRENPSRVVPRGQTDEQTDSNDESNIRFHNFANAPEVSRNGNLV
jgi:hypothetical protein